MNKKFFIGLLLISLVMLYGGCGSSSGPITRDTDVNSAWNGAWTSETNGSATIKSTAAVDDSLTKLTEAFGEVPAEIIEQMKTDEPELYKLYEKEKNQESVETVQTTVTRAVAVFEDCDISKDKGTAKLTAVLIISDDKAYLPIFFSGVALETQRGKTNEWTAKTSDGGTFTINMPSEEKINLSGKFQYFGYECEFSTVINKNPQPASIKLADILDKGTWKFDGTQGGGFLAQSSDNMTVFIPKKVSIGFKDTKEENSTLTTNTITSCRFSMKSENSDGIDEDAVLQDVRTQNVGPLKQIQSNVYKLTQDNSDNFVFIVVNNTDEIFMFTSDKEGTQQVNTFLPLKQEADFNIEAAMAKTWRASKGNGGGYIKYDVAPKALNEYPLLEVLKNISLTLENCTLSFSDVTKSDDGNVKAKLTFNSTLTSNLEVFNDILTNISNFGLDGTDEITFTQSGSILVSEEGDENDGGSMYISFVSDKEALFCIKAATKTDNNEPLELFFTATLNAD